MALDKDDIKQLIAILQKGLVDDNEPESQQSTMPSPKKKKQTSASKKKEHINLFDGMRESKMHKDDVEIDRKLRKLPPVERTREFQPVKVKCRVCGREELMNPALVESMERHKCNKCATSAG